MDTLNEANKEMYSDVISNEFPKLLPMFNQHLDLARWGFNLTHSGVFPQYLPYIVYQSEQCKIRFRWVQDRPYESPTVLMDYGRLHAPEDQEAVLWNGKECRCWHFSGTLVTFLEERSPVEIESSEFGMPLIIHEFMEQYDRQPSKPAQEYHVQLNAHIWTTYGQRIFDLLDVRRPESWEAYRVFLKSYYTHQEEQNAQKGLKRPPLKIPRYEVC